jgi:hypothetical protein
MVKKEELVQTVKGIISLRRDGKADEAYVGYRDLVSRPDFVEHRPEDQRSVLRLLISTKAILGHERPTPKVVEAHKAAVAPLTELVAKYGEPGDYELLGHCYVVVGSPEAAQETFRKGLAIERERSPTSDLCGQFMKLISLL